MPEALDVQSRTVGAEEPPDLTRRASVGGLLGVGVAVTLMLPLRASAQQKVKQDTAKYQSSPKRSQKCSGCSQFQAPDACKLVEGKISAEGWCQLFAAKA